MIKCIFPDGNPGDLRHVTCDMIIVKDNQILLAKRADNVVAEPGKFCVPGGYIDRDEDIKSACLRELKEETGYEGEIQELLLIQDDPERMPESTSDNQNITFVFIIKVGERVGESDHEISEVRWFDLDDLPDNMAFDHANFIQVYKKYQEENFSLPVMGAKNVKRV